MNTSNLIHYPAFRKALWQWTFVVDALGTLAFALWAPGCLKAWLTGCGLGVFYLGSLLFNAEHPRRKIQVVFSLTRMVILAYVIVTLAEARITEIAVVICGLLGYKVVLAVETLKQAWTGLRQMTGFRKSPAGKSNL